MDAAVGNREDMYSQGGSLVCTTDSKSENGVCVPLHWKTRKIPTQCESSTEAETKQSVHCRKSTLYVNDLVHSMLEGCMDGENNLKDEPACVCGDSEDLMSHVYSLRVSMKDKTLTRAVLAMREKLADDSPANFHCPCKI